MAPLTGCMTPLHVWKISRSTPSLRTITGLPSSFCTFLNEKLLKISRDFLMIRKLRLDWSQARHDNTIHYKNSIAKYVFLRLLWYYYRRLFNRREEKKSKHIFIIPIFTHNTSETLLFLSSALVLKFSLKLVISKKQNWEKWLSAEKTSWRKKTLEKASARLLQTFFTRLCKE